MDGSHFYIFCFWMTICFLSACKPETPIVLPEACPPKDQMEMVNCHHTLTWDTTKTRTALIGMWQWKYMGCFWPLSEDGCDGRDAFIIDFRNDNTLTVKKNGTTVQSASWKVVDGFDNWYSIEAEPSVQMLHGKILFCEDIVKFFHSYIDGCDNYFKRLQ